MLADLVVTAVDFPWLRATLHPRAQLETVRPLFVEELQLLDAVDDNVDVWEGAQTRIRQAVTLTHPNGQMVPEFLLHVDGEEAWWRWSDEPFA